MCFTNGWRRRMRAELLEAASLMADHKALREVRTLVSFSLSHDPCEVRFLCGPALCAI
jgi:hypothetical protein